MADSTYLNNVEARRINKGNAAEVVREYLVAAVGAAARGHPADDLVGIANGLQGPARFVAHDL